MGGEKYRGRGQDRKEGVVGSILGWWDMMCP